jgi:hypothetical protein
VSALPVLRPPHAVALPGLDHGRGADSAVVARSLERWPAIEALVEAARWEQAIEALAALAEELVALARSEPEEWQAALREGRLALYDGIEQLAGAAGRPALARETLLACAGHDRELRSELEARAAAAPPAP